MPIISVMITDGGVPTSQSFDVALSGIGSAAATGVGLAPTSAAQTVTLTNTG